MSIQELRTIVNKILVKVYELKNQYISEDLNDIDYVGIAPQNKSAHQQLKNFLEVVGGRIVYSDDWGDVYRIPHPLDTKYGNIELIKISNLKSLGSKKSYADFKIDQKRYTQLNSKYKGKPDFLNIYGEGWEILGITNSKSEVSLFIPNIPLSYDVRNK